MRRFEKSKRKRDNIFPVKTIFLVTEGTKTERIYFQNFRKRGRNVRLVFPDSQHTDPRGIVDYAVSLARGRIVPNGDSFDPGDEIWCVFDVDMVKEDTLQQVKALANRNHITIVLSNPSFELWYLLHYECINFAISNDDTIDRLKHFIADYEKSKDIYKMLEPNQTTAIENARRLVRLHNENEITILSTKSNPSTGVFELVEHLNSI